MYCVWYIKVDNKYDFVNPHFPCSFLLVNSGKQIHSDCEARELAGILDRENFENQNQFAANFIGNI